MKRILLFLAIVTTLSLAGCKKDGGTTPTPKTDTEKANEWIYSTMKTNYLWSDKLPTKENSKLTTPTQTYFDVNLRYRDIKSVPYANDTYGDRFSKLAKIEVLRSWIPEEAATEKDYNFGFERIFVTDNRTTPPRYFLQVLYVVPGSPADIAGLQRGDAFEQISGQSLVSLENVKDLLSQSTISLKILNRDGTPTISITKGLYYNNPVIHTEIFTATGGIKIGYLVYNHFTSGDDSGEGSYLTALKNVFKGFKDAGVTKLILDLRYNGGGEVANAQWLASLIVPSANLNNTWAYMERNYHNGIKSNFEEAKFLSSSEVGGTKAEIDELFFITSKYTASASELMIHSLRPFYTGKLYIVGQTTVGKNVGSREFKNEALGWVMNPITVRIYDKNKVSGYETGIIPDLEETENWTSSDSPYPNFLTLAPLGDYQHEWLLNALIGKYFAAKTSAPAYYNASRSAGQYFEVKANIRERGLTEPPQRMP